MSFKYGAYEDAWNVFTKISDNAIRLLTPVDPAGAAQVAESADVMEKMLESIDTQVCKALVADPLPAAIETEANVLLQQIQAVAQDLDTETTIDRYAFDLENAELAVAEAAATATPAQLVQDINSLIANRNQPFSTQSAPWLATIPDMQPALGSFLTIWLIIKILFLLFLLWLALAVAFAVAGGAGGGGGDCPPNTFTDVSSIAPSGPPTAEDAASDLTSLVVGPANVLILIDIFFGPPGGSGSGSGSSGSSGSEGSSESDSSSCSGCVCACYPGTCEFKLTWASRTPTFFADPIRDRATSAVVKYNLGGSPSRMNIELLSDKGPTGDCCIQQSAYSAESYTAVIDQFIKNRMMKGKTRQQPHRTSYISGGGTKIITQDPRDYDCKDNRKNGAGNATISDRPFTQITRGVGKPMLFDVEVAFDVWCKEDPSVRAGWGYGFTADFTKNPRTASFYRWKRDKDGRNTETWTI